MTSPSRTLQGGQDMGDEPLTEGALALWDEIRDEAGCRPGCTSLRVQTTCLLGNGPVPSSAVIVGDAPTDEDDVTGTPGHGDGPKLLDAVLKGLDVDLAEVYHTFAVSCCPPDGAAKKPDLKEGRKTCARFLEAELRRVRPRAILAMGAEAYYHFTHKEGITKNRGQAFWHDEYGCWVVPTLNPLQVMLNPQYLSAFEADVAKWWRLTQRDFEPPAVEIVEVRTFDGEQTYADERGGSGSVAGSLGDFAPREGTAQSSFEEMMGFFAEEPDRLLTFDLETRGFHSQRNDYSFVWCLAISDGRDLGNGMRTYLVPFEHPDSPWPYYRLDTRPIRMKILEELRTLLLGDRRVNGHNVKFDLRWLHRAMERYGLVESHV